MVGRELTGLFPEQILSDSPETVLECRDLRSGKEVKGVSFALKRGSVTGLAGLAGAGRTEVAEVICGLRKRNGGKSSNPANGEDSSVASGTSAKRCCGRAWSRNHACTYQFLDKRQRADMRPVW